MKRCTNKKCSKGGIEQPLDEFHRDRTQKDGRNGWCKECIHLFNHLYNQSPAAIANRGKRARDEALRLLGKKVCSNSKCSKGGIEQPLDAFHRDRCKKSGLESWCKECVSEASRASYKANRERHLAYGRAWYERNRESYLAYDREWKTANPEKVREYHARRRARKLEAAVGVVSYEAILARDGYRCHICSGEVDSGDVHFDHVIPLARGGAHSEDNIKVAHSRCNLRKNARMPEEVYA